MYQLKRFIIKEFVPPTLWNAEGEQSIQHLDERILETADQVREFFGVPVTINNWGTTVDGQFHWRGLRTSEYPDYRLTDPHVKGMAIDFDVAGKTAGDVRATIIMNPKEFPYIYRMENNVNWVHGDMIGIDIHPRESIYLFNA